MIVNKDPWKPFEWPSVLEEQSSVRVLALDPGGVTGWSVGWLGRDGQCEIKAHGQIDSIMLPDFEGWSHYKKESVAVDEVMEMVNRWSIDVVVAEDFVLRERTSDRTLLGPSRLLSICADRIDTDDVMRWFHLQSASDAKSTIGDERLRGLGAWYAGAQHARDAARHFHTFALRYRKNIRSR